MLKSRPAKYHLLIPAGIPENIRAEVEQRQKTVSLILYIIVRVCMNLKTARK